MAQKKIKSLKFGALSLDNYIFCDDDARQAVNVLSSGISGFLTSSLIFSEQIDKINKQLIHCVRDNKDSYISGSVSITGNVNVDSNLYVLNDITTQRLNAVTIFSTDTISAQHFYDTVNNVDLTEYIKNTISIIKGISSYISAFIISADFIHDLISSQLTHYLRNDSDETLTGSLTILGDLDAEDVNALHFYDLTYGFDLSQEILKNKGNINTLSADYNSFKETSQQIHSQIQQQLAKTLHNDRNQTLSGSLNIKGQLNVDDLINTPFLSSISIYSNDSVSAYHFYDLSKQIDLGDEITQVKVDVKQLSSNIPGQVSAIIISSEIIQEWLENRLTNYVKNNEDGTITGSLSITDNLTVENNLYVINQISTDKLIAQSIYSANTISATHFFDITANLDLVEEIQKKADIQSPTFTGLVTVSGKFANGNNCQANGNYSHAEGNNTITNTDYQHVEGSYNTPVSGKLIIGGGNQFTQATSKEQIDELSSSLLHPTLENYTQDNENQAHGTVRGNIFELSDNGDAEYAGNVKAEGFYQSDGTKLNNVEVQKADAGLQIQDPKFLFYGNKCLVLKDAEGNIISRIGENQNTSNFNNVDGTTNGIVSYEYNSLSENYIPGIDLGEGVPFYNGLLTIQPEENIHIANNTSTNIIVSAFIGKDNLLSTLMFGPITGNNNYYDVNSSMMLKVNNFKNQPNINEGATGYTANIKLSGTVQSLNKIAPNKDITFKIKHNNSGEDTKQFNIDQKVFIVNDKTTLPSIGTVSINFGTPTVKTCSGIKYICSSSATISVDSIQNIAKPARLKEKNIKITSDGNWFTDIEKTNQTAKNSTDIISASYQVSLKTIKCQNAKANLIVKNINGQTEKTYSGSQLKLLIDANSNRGCTDLKQSFYDQTRRLNSVDLYDQHFYNNETSLQMNNGLQVKFGELIYPTSESYYGFNDGISEIVGILQPDYTNINGDRQYIRKFTKGGDVNSVTVTITGSNIKTNKESLNLSFEMMNRQDKAYGATWKNVTFGQPGAIYVGADSSFTENKAILKIAFGNGSANASVYFKVKMKQGCNAKINSIIVE